MPSEQEKSSPTPPTEGPGTDELHKLHFILDGPTYRIPVPSIAEPSADMRHLAHRMAELAAALKQAGFDDTYIRNAVDHQIFVALFMMRRGTYRDTP